jgi:invasion protein IalB
MRDVMICRIAAGLIMLALGSSALAAPAAKDAPKESAKDATKEAPKPAPVPSTPERTTATFGDWILRCEMPPAPAKRACEVALILTAQGQTSAIAQVALGRASSDGQPMTIVLPHNISLLSKPRVLSGKSDATALEFTWQRCTPGACFASAVPQSDTVVKLGAQAEAGKIVYKNAAEQEVVLPMSIRGLTQALEALLKEP